MKLGDPAKIVPGKATFSFSSFGREPVIRERSVRAKAQFGPVPLWSLRLLWGLKERQNHFDFAIKIHPSLPMGSPFAVASLQAPDGLIFWKQHFGRRRSVLRIVQKSTLSLY